MSTQCLLLPERFGDNDDDRHHYHHESKNEWKEKLVKIRFW
jgi:hypothetical protein